MTPSEFKAQFPEFASESDARVLSFIDRAEPHFDLDRWADLHQDALAHFVAHSLTMANAQTAQSSGALELAHDVQSKKVGDVQLNKSTELLSRQADNPFFRTLYGQHYLYLRRLVGAGALAL